MRLYLLVSLMFLVSICVFAGGGPEIETEIFLSQPPQYISPGTPETGRDELRIENIQISIQDNISIRSYELRIYDMVGQVIYSVMEENLEGRGFFDELFDIGKLPSVKIPQSMAWDGRNNDGNMVPDGEYFYQLYVRDSKNRQVSTAPLAVVVDRNAPEIVNLNSDLQFFSPNDDGRQDSIFFFMQTTPAQRWTLEVQQSSGLIVVSELYLSQGSTATNDIIAPSQFEWDGRDLLGNLVSESEYQFILTGIDRAGNIARKSLDFTLSNATSNIDLSIKDGSSHFSHRLGMDKTFLISVDETEGIESWKMEISDENNIVVRRFTGILEDFPQNISFNGRGNPGRPERGNLLMEDGQYHVLFSIFYADGNISTSLPLNIIIDSQPPGAFLSVDSAPQKRIIDDPLYFGGVSKPFLIADASFDERAEWSIVIIREEDDELIFPLNPLLRAGLQLPYQWDGRNPVTNEEFPDGSYQVFLRATDAAGNVGRSDVIRFVKDSQDRGEVSVGFSQTKPTVVRIIPDVPVTEGIKQFHLNIINEDDGRVYYTRPLRRVSPFVDWAGNQNNGALAPLGNYRVELDVLYYNGDNVIIRSSQFISNGLNGVSINAIPIGVPRVYLTLENKPFSPDGDGKNDSTRIKLGAEDSAPSSWQVEILDPYENLFKTWAGAGYPPSELIWNGVGDNGELVQSAFDYKVLFTLENSVGIQGTATGIISVDVLVIAEGDRLRINVPSIYFTGNSSDLFAIGLEEREKNFATLRRLAEVLNKYGKYSISVEGHAAQLFTGLEGQEEQTTVLIPLSRNRATEVKHALTILGVDSDRMTIRGFGGTIPVVPHSDAENRWKNRRVEFILE